MPEFDLLTRTQTLVRELVLQLSSHPPIEEVRVAWGRPELLIATGPSWIFVLNPSWLWDVYEEGIALVERCIILHAEPCSPANKPDGCEAWLTVVAKPLAPGYLTLNQRHNCERAFLVRYGGELALASTAKQAAECVMAPFKKVFLGG